MEILTYVINDAYILIPALYIFGVFLKATPYLADWLIPWVLVMLGIVGGLFFVGFNPNGVIQGILVAGVTVLGNQLWKQAVNKD